MLEKLSRIGIAFAIIAISATSLAGVTAASSGCTIAGSAGATLTIEEFSDFECPYCAKGSNTMKEVLKNYSGKVNLVFRNLPLSAHQHSLAAAKAFSAVCLQSPEMAYSFQKEIFKHQDKLTSEGAPYLYEVAESLGVDLPQMKSDMNGEVVAKSIAEDQRLAASHNFKGTPSFMIGTEALVGAQPYDEFKKIIDRQLGQ